MDQTVIPNPDIKWDGNTWFVTLPVEDGNVLEAKWSPPFTYVVRIREAGSDQWSFGSAVVERDSLDDFRELPEAVEAARAIRRTPAC